MNPEQRSFLHDWALMYEDLCREEGLEVRLQEPDELERKPLPDTTHRCTLFVPMTVIRPAHGTEYADGAFEEHEEAEPVLCTYDAEHQILSVEVRVEDRFYDSDDLHFLYYSQGFEDYVEQTADLRLLGELEDQLGFDPASVGAYERIRLLTHIASHSFRNDGNTSLSFGFSATIQELEEMYTAIPSDSPLYTDWDSFVTTVLTAAADSIRAIYPTLYRYMYYWYAEGEDRAAYEHLQKGQADPPHSVFDEAMQITRGRSVEDSRFYERLARERLLASPYWIGQWALGKLDDGTFQSARFADAAFDERDDPRLLVCTVRVPTYYYDGDVIAGETSRNENVLIYWDHINGEIRIEMRQLFDFGLGDASEEELDRISDRLGTGRGRFSLFRSTLARQTDDHPYIAYGSVIRGSDGEAVTDEVDALKKVWKVVLDQLRSYRMDVLGKEY